MDIPFLKQPGVDKQTRRPYNLIVHMDDELKNRLWMTDQAELRCTCDDYRSSRECRHTKEKSNEFLRWKRAAMQRIRGELCEGLPAATLASVLSNRLDIPLDMAQYLVTDNGEVYVQYDPGTSQRHSQGSGWGTMGRKVHISSDPSEAGALYLVASEMGYEVIDPLDLVEEILTEIPTMPPSVFKDGSDEESALREAHAGGLYGGQGGVVLLVEDTQAKEARPVTSGDAWAAYWARLCGLKLVGAGWSGVNRYLPGGNLDGKQVGGLAIDLANCRVKGIPAEVLEDYSAGVPVEYRNQIGHVHLPWGPESEQFPGAMVLVKHPTRPGMDQDDNLVVLTTNFWQGIRNPESAEVRCLIELTAAYLLRMGHNPAAYLYYGEWVNQIGPLAKVAESHLVDASASRWEISDQGFTVLRDEVVPSLLNNSKCPVIEGEFGADWPQFLPPE